MICQKEVLMTYSEWVIPKVHQTWTATSTPCQKHCHTAGLFLWINIIHHISSAVKWPHTDWIAVQFLAWHSDFTLHHHVQNASWVHLSTCLTWEQRILFQDWTCVVPYVSFSTMFACPYWTHSIHSSSEIDSERFILFPGCTNDFQICECILGR